MKSKFLFFSCVLLIQISVKAQMKIGDNPTNINSASLLELESTDKGFVFPRVLLTDMASSSPLPSGLLAGTVVYNTNAAITNGNGTGLYVWGGLVWMSISTGSISGTTWSLTGNSGTNYTTNFIGTTDKVSFRMRTNNIQRMLIDSIGDVGIGSEAFNPVNRERLLVDYGTTSSNTIANFRGNINNYFQLNVQNTSGGAKASSDFVATANDGTDSTYYVDMGINSSAYNPSPENWGGAHDAYFYSNSKNLLMGTQADSSDVIFLLGGGQLKNTVLQLKGPSGAVVVGSGEGTDSVVGNVVRAPNAKIDAADAAGGDLTISGGRSTGTARGGDLLLKGGGTGLSGSGNGGNINIAGGNSINGTDGTVSINVGKSTGDVKIGGTDNNIIFSKFSTAGGLYYTVKSSGQISTTGANMTWDSINNRLGIGTITPTNKLSVFGANPLYLSGVQPTAAFTTDSILTIFNGVVKKAPYSSLPGGGGAWTTTGNNGTTYLNNFIGTIDNISMRFRTNNVQRMVIDSTGKVGIGISRPPNALSVLATDPLYLSGVQATTTFTTDSILTIKAGIVKKAPYSSLPSGGGSGWLLTGNSGTNPSTNFLGTTDNNALVFKVGGVQAGYLGIATSSDITLFGTGATAASQQSTALGAGAIASQQASLAAGYKANAGSQNAIAIGSNASSSVTGGIAMGSGAIVSSQNGIAIGAGAAATTSINTLAIGTGARATAQNATAFGYNSLASSIGANAFGNLSNASGTNSLAIGNSTTASGSNSMSIGDLSTAAGANPIVLGLNSFTDAASSNAIIVGSASSITGTATSSILIGDGLTTSQSNVLILGNSAKTVGISTTTPNANAKLDVNGPFKLGDAGTVTKNSVSFSRPVNVQVPLGIGNSIDVTFSIPGRLGSTQATVAVSPDNDLPNNIFIAFARVLTVNQVTVRLMNLGTVNIPVSGNFYFTVTEF